MKILSNTPLPDGSRQMTIHLEADEDLSAIIPDHFYKVDDLVVPGHQLISLRPVYWDVASQKWEDA